MFRFTFLFSRLSQNHVIYLLVHVLLFMLGIVVYYTQPRDPLWGGVAGSLSAAGIAGWVIFVYVFVSQERSDRLKILERFGFIKGFTARSMSIKAEYDVRLAAASRAIDL